MPLSFGVRLISNALYQRCLEVHPEGVNPLVIREAVTSLQLAPQSSGIFGTIVNTGGYKTITISTLTAVGNALRTGLSDHAIAYARPEVTRVAK
jgi:hypothetical protein